MSLFVREENLRQYLKKYPVTSIILFLTTLVFILTCIDGGSTNLDTVIKYGALYPPLFFQGEYYRILTLGLTQVGGIPHYLGNISCILIFAPPLERMLGSYKFTFLYLLANIGGGAAVIYFNPDTVTSGASGFVFGMVGAYLALMFRKSPYLDRDAKKYMVSYSVFAIIYTFAMPNISIPGHIGGLLSGFLFTSLFPGRTRSGARGFIEHFLPIALAALLIILFFNFQGNSSWLNFFKKNQTPSGEKVVIQPNSNGEKSAGTDKEKIIDDANWSNEKYNRITPLINELITYYNHGTYSAAEVEPVLRNIESVQQEISSAKTEISNREFASEMAEQQKLLIGLFDTLNNAAESCKAVISTNFADQNNSSKFSEALDQLTSQANDYTQSLTALYQKEGIEYTYNNGNK